MSLPKEFVERLTQQLGESQACALCAALDEPRPTSIRLNPNKIVDFDKCQRLERIGWSEYGYYLPQRISFTEDPPFHAGAYYVQEASSQFISHILSSEDLSRRRVLDMCAAPGGKTTLYSTLVGREGVVLANEISRQRASILADNVRKWGLGNVMVSCNNPLQIAQAEAYFDLVAVDAPCSGEGMFRRGEAVRAEWSVNAVYECAQRQRDIVEQAWYSLKAGGVLIYSTCTFNTLENEELLEYFEAMFEGEVEPYQSVEVEDDWGIVRGEVGAFQTFRFYPHKAKGEGFFVAVARKSAEQHQRQRQRLPKSYKKVINPLDRASAKACGDWVEESEAMRFSQIGDVVFAHHISGYEEVVQLSGFLNIIYSGVAIGQLYHKVLKPDHPLALYVGLRRENISCVELDKVEILSYLRKNSVDPALFEQGLNLVTHEGYALGFVKRISQRVNNLYPNSMRILRDVMAISKGE